MKITGPGQPTSVREKNAIERMQSSRREVDDLKGPQGNLVFQDIIENADRSIRIALSIWASEGETRPIDYRVDRQRLNSLKY